MTAEDDDNQDGAASNSDEADRDLRTDVRRLIFEVRIVLESVAAGLEHLARRPEAVFLKEELAILGKLVAQAAEAVESFDAVVGPGTMS